MRNSRRKTDGYQPRARREPGSDEGDVVDEFENIVHSQEDDPWRVVTIAGQVNGAVAARTRSMMGENLLHRLAREEVAVEQQNIDVVLKIRDDDAGSSNIHLEIVNSPTTGELGTAVISVEEIDAIAAVQLVEARSATLSGRPTAAAARVQNLRKSRRRSSRSSRPNGVSDEGVSDNMCASLAGSRRRG